MNTDKKQVTHDYKNNSLHLARKYARISVLGPICSEKRTVFRERSSRKTVSFEEQIMSTDKYLSTFSPRLLSVKYFSLHARF